jgi:phosphoenolpyruvate carboxykinase (ATP)
MLRAQMSEADMSEADMSEADMSEADMPQAGAVHKHWPAAALVEEALRRGEGVLADNRAFVAYTGARTGRSPRDRFLVADPTVKNDIAWGNVNQPMEPATYARLLAKSHAYCRGRELFVFEGWACADPRYRLPVRVIAEKAWHALFAQCLLLRPASAPENFRPELTVLHVAGLAADPATDGTHSAAFILLNFKERQVLIGGTHYAGEIKKSIFTFLNYLMPKRGVFPMHCSANIGPAGDTALLFGLSGTGKTTLSADPERRLIGDDEHGWSDQGVFNFEGGCYAKCINLSREHEPQIWDAIRFGAVLENVVLDPQTRTPNYASDHFTENTRAAYPVEFIDNIEPTGCGGHPRNILFLACDAFGVLPPLSKLTPAQTQYHFLSGYTAKVAGTEAGVTEPEATFSACFASPFLPLPPTRYAQMLHDKTTAHRATVWLVNTGWTGGVYGHGSRIKLAYTRSLVRAALNGQLDSVAFAPDPIFKVLVPAHCPGVPDRVLNPRASWTDPTAYEARSRNLARLFEENFKQFAPAAGEDVRRAGPAA